MKNLFLTIATVLSLATVTFASNIGEGDLAVLKSEKVVVTLDNETQKEFIISSAFEEDKDNIVMVFESNVSMIQIFNKEGELEMMLPIESTEVNLGMSLFNKGNYKMGFSVDGISEVQFTNLQVK